MEEDDDWDPSDTSRCLVVGQCASHFQYDGGRAAPSHIIEYDGSCFPVKTSALVRFVATQERKARALRAR